MDSKQLDVARKRIAEGNLKKTIELRTELRGRNRNGGESSVLEIHEIGHGGIRQSSASWEYFRYSRWARVTFACNLRFVGTIYCGCSCWIQIFGQVDGELWRGFIKRTGRRRRAGPLEFLSGRITYSRRGELQDEEDRRYWLLGMTFIMYDTIPYS